MNAAAAPPQNFLLLLRYNLFYVCQRNARKNITVTVSVRVSVTVRVSLVWFVRSNSFGGVKCRHLPCIAKFSRFTPHHIRPASVTLHRALQRNVYIVYRYKTGQLLTCIL